MIIKELSGRITDSPLWQEFLRTKTQLAEINNKHWLGMNIFTPVWWLMLITFFVAWLVWWKLVKKDRLLEIIMYGLMIAVVSTVLDNAGVNFGLWAYPNMLFPAVPPLFFVDLCALPIIYMLVYQYFSRWRSFLIASIIMAFVISFIGEPLAVRLEIYQLTNWKHIYSLPIYFLLAVLTKWLCQKLLRRQNSARA